MKNLVEGKMPYFWLTLHRLVVFLVRPKKKENVKN